jgi:ribosomal protein S18 acetylase RimI-like enzyme
MQIRELTIDDYDRLIGVWREAGLPCRPSGRDRRDRVAQEMADSRSAFLAAEENGSILGVVVATHDGRKGWINRLAVVPHARRLGVAASLVAAAEERLAAQGLRIIACLIENENDASLALFATLGYARLDDIVYHAKRLDPDA